MERGILWSALLGVFVWLAWQGKKEFQKVEAYQQWAAQFERAKYDIYAVLGQKGTLLTWGKPTPKGMIDIQSFDLKDVQTLRLLVDNSPINLENLPVKGRAIAIEFQLESQPSIRVPFTEIPLAAEWTKYLQSQL